MTEDRTLHQTAAGQLSSKELSEQATTPPAEVPGYRLQRFLGAGAFGQVWVGKNLNTGRQVAVKFYLHRGGVNWSLLSREVKNLVQLSADRHVVQVLEVGWEADPPYYVMELVDGGSLEDLLRVRHRLPVDEAVELFRKICIGLSHCHSKGVLHCDVKPANILIAEDDEPRLADFGQSRMSHDQTATLGTLFYMAPEQADLIATPDASWDVYAAGAILFRMLTGDPPYRNADLIGKMDTAASLPQRLTEYREAIAGSSPPIAHQSRRGVDRGLSRIVSKCLAPDPRDRYSNMEQILGALEQREQTRSRRPLMLLGIVGPILLLCVTCLFAGRSIDSASEKTKLALREEAFGSNQLAARFAARTLEGEVERYFNLVDAESRRSELRTAIRRLLSTPEIAQSIEEISGAESAAQALEQTDARERLLDVPLRKSVDAMLDQRLSRYANFADQRRRIQLASIFVTDARGTILAMGYRNPVPRDQNSIGRNYSYRTYFHGGRDDLPKATPIASIAPLRQTHLSSAFQSTATGMWKVASSTPIDFDSDGLVDAVFVITINLGDFQLLQSERGANQIAVLIEARPGPLRGTVLQHPLMNERRRRNVPLAGERFQVAGTVLDQMIQGGDIPYRDPLGQVQPASRDGVPAADEDPEMAVDYGGEWIVAMQPVNLPVRDTIDASLPPVTESIRVAEFVSKDASENDEPANSDDTGDQNDTGDQAEAATPSTFKVDRELDTDGQSNRTDLLVLVQYRLAKVWEPVTNLRRALFIEGAAAVGSILFVTLMLWLLVARVTHTRDDVYDDSGDAENRRRGGGAENRRRGGGADDSDATRPAESTETLDASHRSAGPAGA